MGNIVNASKSNPPSATSSPKKKPLPEIVSCEYCNALKSSEAYQEHLLTCEENPENTTLPCDYCKEPFDLSKLSKHLELCELNPSNIKIICEFCKEEIAFEDNKHLDICHAHPNQAPILCEFCNGKFTVGTYGEHFKVCRANPANIKLKCDYCGRKFNAVYYEEHQQKCEISFQEEVDDGKECAICLIEMREEEKTVLLDCMHRFHERCVTNWKKKQNNCPTCRVEIDSP